MAKQFGEVLKKNLLPAVAAVFGGGAIMSFAGEWIAKVPMADSVFFGQTVGFGIGALAALVIVDYIQNR